MHPEKTVEELEALLNHIRSSAPRPKQKVPRVHALERRLDKSSIDEIVQRYEAGDSSLVIAADYNVSSSALIGLLRSRGVTIREQPLTSDLVQHGVALYRSGLTVQQAANELGVAKTTLYRAFKKAEVVMRTR